jgi:hypothetical protein
MFLAPPINLLEIASDRLHMARLRHRWAMMAQASFDASHACDEAALDMVLAARDLSTLQELAVLCS